MKVIFCSSEVFPFAKTGGLADVCGALPLALSSLGVEVNIFLPRYRSISDEDFHIERVNDFVSQTKLGENIPVYLIENKEFFDREGLYGTSAGDYPDNLERFQYFCSHVLSFLKKSQLKTGLIHCHDWQTALIPVYLKEDPSFKKIKSLLTIHNLAYQGIFPKKEFSKLKVKKDFLSSNFEFYDQINMLKAGIIYSDRVTTVSPQYAKEIQTPEFGCGLEGVLRHRKDEVTGILNGIDTNVWDPATDKLIFRPYSSADYAEAKIENKKALQKKLGLSVESETPVFGFVGRLSHQKGVDLILESAKQLLELPVQFIIHGVGDEKYKFQLKTWAQKYPQKIAVCLEFNEQIAHQIYASSDFFLMPSIFEPCGLSQLISLRYGTIPVVFNVGGLVDTIISFDQDDGNGFVFTDYTKAGFISVIQDALEVFQNKAQHSRLIENAFKANFSWDQSAKEYIRVYEKLS